MKRRSFLGLGTLFPALSRAQSDPPPENVFAAAWNAWIVQRAQDTPGIIDARELHLWKGVEEAWKVLKRSQEARH
jgi:hypothetical protein